MVSHYSHSILLHNFGEILVIQFYFHLCMRKNTNMLYQFSLVFIFAMQIANTSKRDMLTTAVITVSRSFLIEIKFCIISVFLSSAVIFWMKTQCNQVHLFWVFFQPVPRIQEIQDPILQLNNVFYLPLLHKNIP